MDVNRSNAVEDGHHDEGNDLYNCDEENEEGKELWERLHFLLHRGALSRELFVPPLQKLGPPTAAIRYSVPPDAPPIAVTALEGTVIGVCRTWSKQAEEEGMGG